MGKGKDSTGKKVGVFKIIKRKRENNRTYYYCQCEKCGNKKWIRADCLKTIHSCGCLTKDTQFKSVDITNKQFGRLKALKPTGERDKNNGSVIWKCSCDCGNICFKTIHDLSSNRVKSCGCLKEEAAP